MIVLAVLLAVVVVIGAAVVGLAATRAAAEVNELHREIERLGHLRPALVDVRHAGAELRATLLRLHR
ncbi:MAG: hypothetical protein M3Q48_10095 [Actinomycetota bacterium]|nr:hypothetical protein [Actinomycetota bacterium]